DSSRPLASLAALVAVLPALACASGGANTTMRTPDRVVSTTIETSTGTKTVDVRNSGGASRGADLSMPLEQAWGALQKVYDEIGLTAGGSMDPEGHTYGVVNKPISRIAGRHMDEYLDCGSGLEGPRADTYAVRISAFTRLTGKDGGTRAETLVQATAKPRGVSGNTVPCRSRGTLERLIVERLVAGTG
ncbi:MAG: hypothetical protein P8Z36_12305, partial [Gemmatimonadota bacterium]